MTELMRRRRALMAVGGGGEPEPNGLVDGTYTVSGFTLTVLNNSISAGTVSNYKDFKIPFKKPLELKAGDVVKFTAEPTTYQSTITLPVGFNNNYFSSGGNFSPYQNPPTVKTVTISSDMVAEYFRIQSISGMSNKTFTLILKVNGEDVFA